MERKYGLIGYPLGHSFSQRYFTEKFERDGIDAAYSLYPLENINLLSSLISDSPNLKGLNVTIPYKEDVIRFLDEVSDDVKEIGAVNVIKISNKDGKRSLKGYNSDFVGFSDSLKPILREEVKNALVLGTGGASKAVVYALKNLGITPTLVSRTHKEGVLSYEELNEEIMAKNLLIVNTTPLGMFPKVDACAPIPYHLLTGAHICYDLVYNPETTEFMRRAEERGATVKNGLEMLYRQAERAWDIWNSSL